MTHQKPDDNIIERIRKLLAMSQDVSSPNEAAIAARRVESLLRKYNLDAADFIMQELKQGESIHKEDVRAGIHRGTKSAKVPPWAQDMAIKCAELFDCHVIMAYNPDHGTVLRFVGYKTDAEICRWTFVYLQEQLRRFMHIYVTQHPGIGRSASNSYRTGLAHGIKRGLMDAKAAKDAENAKMSTSTSLVVAKREAIEREIGEVKYGTRHSNLRDAQAYARGVRDGRSVNVNPSVLRDQTQQGAKIRS